MDDSNDNSLVAIVDEVAPDGWKKRVAAVLFQMGIGSKKLANFYGAGRENLDIVEGRSIVNKALAEAVARQAVNDPEQVERMKARLLGTAMREQENLEAVLGAAESQMLALPPPVVTDGGSEQHEREAAEKEPLDPDWADAFTRQAEQANSEDMRDRLSRVLAGEVASPGKFPRAVFRAIVELEKTDIEAVRKALPYRLGRQLFLGPESSADELLKLTLNSSGMLESGYIANRWIRLEQQKSGLFSKIERRGNIALLIQAQNDIVQIGESQLLSRVGQTAFELLDTDPRQTLIATAAGIQREGMRIWLITVTAAIGDQISYRIEHLLFNGLPENIPLRV